jgi:hypothetical protein
MTTVDVNPPRWVPDPAGRFAQRYWDGASWTEYVAGLDGGAASSDPLGPGAPPVRQLPDPAAAASEVFASPPPVWRAPTDSEPPPSPPVDRVAADEAAGHPSAPTTSGGHGRPAGWELDPTGRHAQRYWDGGRWTEFVAGAVGGAAAIDPTPIVGLDADRPPDPETVPGDGPSDPTANPGAAVRPRGADVAAVGVGSFAAATVMTGGAAAPISWTDATRPVAPRPAPEDGEPGPDAGSESQGRRLTKPVVAAAVLALLIAGAAALGVAGVFGGHGSSAPLSAHRVVARPKRVGTRVGAAAVTTPTSAAAVGKAAVVASKDPAVCSPRRRSPR